jgi:hypothetical protein
VDDARDLPDRPACRECGATLRALPSGWPRDVRRGRGGAAVSECWAAAVAVAAENPPPDLRAAVAEELVALWSDLGEALRRTGWSWSIECDGLVVRIVMLSRLSGTTSREWIPEPLLASGIYQGILRSADITFTQPGPGRDTLAGQSADAPQSAPGVSRYATTRRG